MNAIQLKFKFDAQRIHKELLAIADSFKTIYTPSTQFDQLSGMHLILPLPENKKNDEGYTYQYSQELKQSPYLQSVLETFQCDKFVYRVHNLKANSNIEPHRDRRKGLGDRIVRILIPVTTNEEVYFYVKGERVNMQNGECWFADVTQLHKVENRSDQHRLQLMIDCDLNNWWKEILSAQGVVLEKEHFEWREYTIKELQMMKENIRSIGIPFDQSIMEKIDLRIDKKAKDFNRS